MRCMHKCKRYYKRTLVKNVSDNDIIRYKEYRNVLNTIKWYSKIHYYQQKCIEHERNTSKLWQLINNAINKTNDKSCIAEKIKIGNLLVNDPKKIANHFGEYFSTVGEEYTNKISSPKIDITTYLGKINSNNKTIFMEPTTQMEILKLINNLPGKKSSGYDGISNVLLKEIAPLILIP